MNTRPVGGGGGVAAANLAREFVRLGHSVDYVTTHYRGFARQEEIAGVHLWREPVLARQDLHTATILSMLCFPAVGFWRGFRLARQTRYDLINTHFAIPTGPAGYLLSKWLGLPNVLTVYGGDIYDPSKPYSPHRHPALGWVVKRMLNQANVVIAESNDIAQRTADIYGTPSEKIQRIPLGFSPTKFERASREQLGLRPDRIYAISVSRLIPRKAFSYLLRAMHLARVSNLELLIIGEGPEETKLRQLVSELDLAGKVRFLGACDETTKYQYLSVADFFALASLHEGFGVVFQEAMHCGLPIVTTNSGGQTDFLNEGQSALLTDPQNPEAFARSLVRMATDSRLRQQMRENNLRDIQAHSIESVARQYLKLFNAVIEQKTQQGAKR